jgi:hypothetical protein
MMYFYFDPAALQDRLKGSIAAVHAGGVLPLIASPDQGADDCQKIQTAPISPASVHGTPETGKLSLSKADIRWMSV